MNGKKVKKSPAKPSPIKLERASLPTLSRPLDHSPQQQQQQPDPSASCLSQYNPMTNCGGLAPGQQQGQQGDYLSPQQYTPISQPATSMEYNTSPTCTMYDYQMTVGNKAQVHDSMISPQPQHSPVSYYSPPASLHQVPVEGTITATSCNYNSYYPYGISESPSHGQTSPLSSHHSSPIMHPSPQIHPSSTLPAPLM